MQGTMLRAALLLTGAVSALKPASRRHLLQAAPAVATGLIAAPALAEDFQASLKPLYKAAKTAKLTYRSKAGEPPPEAWAEDAFVGRYTDPINHPGGIRDITLTDTFIGEYRLVKVVGGGGRGEPKEYVLPGLVDASAQIKFCAHVRARPPSHLLIAHRSTRIGSRSTSPCRPRAARRT